MVPARSLPGGGISIEEAVAAGAVLYAIAEGIDYFTADEDTGPSADAIAAAAAGAMPGGAAPDPNDPFGQMQTHHLLPQQFRQQFEQAGINIDDPELLVEMPSGNHYLVHGAWGGIDGLSWNAEWESFFLSNPAAGPGEIMEQLARMMIQFGLVPP